MKLNKRRRLENKTNYRKRIVLLKGANPRLVIRKSNKYILFQVVESIHAQDKIVYSVSTKELLDYGWAESKSGSLKSLGASYLAGILLGNKAKNLKGQLILDTGLVPSTKGSRIYSGVKGVIDAGLKINCDKEMMPTKEMIEKKDGKMISEVLSKIKGGKTGK